MPDFDERRSKRYVRGSDTARRFFSLFGLRSARMERERQEDSESE